jgi:hypothetical protein
MTPAPPFDCADCHRRIGKTKPHLILDDRRVVCIRHHTEYYDAGRIAHGFCTRAAAANLLGVWP